ncbi:MAG: hypothetical protein ACKVQJ_05710 [Pyrinomonadaceae bacterium]
MTIREKIVLKVQNLPDGALADVYEFIEKVEVKENDPGLLRRLQKIKIEGPRDFSTNIDLYLTGEKKVEDNIR